jgi:hypothetical protein
MSITQDKRRTREAGCSRIWIGVILQCLRRQHVGGSRKITEFGQCYSLRVFVQPTDSHSESVRRDLPVCT